jgi:hypothetical protein
VNHYIYRNFSCILLLILYIFVAMSVFSVLVVMPRPRRESDQLMTLMLDAEVRFSAEATDALSLFSCRYNVVFNFQLEHMPLLQNDQHYGAKKRPSDRNARPMNIAIGSKTRTPVRWSSTNIDGIVRLLISCRLCLLQLFLYHPFNYLCILCGLE